MNSAKKNQKKEHSTERMLPRVSPEERRRSMATYVSSSNIHANTNLEKDTILPVDFYAKTFFDTVKQKYLDMLE